jgi:hypothetical protein
MTEITIGIPIATNRNAFWYAFTPYLDMYLSRIIQKLRTIIKPIIKTISGPIIGVKGAIICNMAMSGKIRGKESIINWNTNEIIKLLKAIT